MAKKLSEHLYLCAGCGITVKGTRLPRGWKHVGDQDLCKDCFRSRYAVRSVALPVFGPLEHTWEELNQATATAWRLSTDLANWMVAEMFRRDMVPVGSRELPKFIMKGKDTPDGWYGYGHAREHYPDFSGWDDAKNNLNIVLRAVERKYIQTRYDVLFRHAQALLTYRYPYPYPVGAPNWTPLLVDDFPAVRLSLPDTGNWTLRLKRSADLGRQLAGFRQLLQGQAIKGEAALYRKGKHLMLKMVGWFPRQPVSERIHACVLHTDPSAFLVAEIDGRSPWILNEDQLCRWKMAHEAYLQRTGEDLKREKRMDRRQRQNLLQARHLREQKFDNRMNSSCQMLAAQVARFCQRQKVAYAVFDNHCQKYLPSFRWGQFEESLRNALDNVGVVLVERDTLKVTINEEEELKWHPLIEALSLAGKRMLASRKRVGGHPAVTAAREMQRS